MSNTQQPIKVRRKAVVREERFEMRLSTDERTAIETAAELGGEPSSAFARRAILAAARAAIAKAERSP